MTKKVIRIFFTVCLMLVMTANIAFARNLGHNTARNVDFNYSITRDDKIVNTCSEDNCNVRVGGRIFVYYDLDDQQWDIRFIKTNIMSVNADANSYTYQVEYGKNIYKKYDRSMMSLYILKDGKRIGEIFFDVTKNYGNLYRYIY